MRRIISIKQRESRNSIFARAENARRRIGTQPARPRKYAGAPLTQPDGGLETPIDDMVDKNFLDDVGADNAVGQGAEAGLYAAQVDRFRFSAVHLRLKHDILDKGISERRHMFMNQGLMVFAIEFQDDPNGNIFGYFPAFNDRRQERIEADKAKLARNARLGRLALFATHRHLIAGHGDHPDHDQTSDEK